MTNDPNSAEISKKRYYLKALWCPQRAHRLVAPLA
jgi:hypothetical protein